MAGPGRPTHRVTHIESGFSVGMTLSSIQTKALRAGGGAARSARDFICIRFRSLCETKPGAPRLKAYLPWGDLSVEELVGAREESRCCGDERCKPCNEMTMHHYCSKGCTLGR